jgi:hypothetical protein
MMRVCGRGFSSREDQSAIVTEVRATKRCTTLSVSIDIPVTGGGSAPIAHTVGASFPEKALDAMTNTFQLPITFGESYDCA